MKSKMKLIYWQYFKYFFYFLQAGIQYVPTHINTTKIIYNVLIRNLMELACIIIIQYYIIFVRA